MRLSLFAWFAMALLGACGVDASAPEEAGAAPGPATDVVRHPAENAQPAKAGDDLTSPRGSGTPCTAQPACDGTAGPELGARRPFVHPVLSSLVVAAGPAVHRGRDQIVSALDPQWVIGKIAYGYLDGVLGDEEVDIVVERGCGGTWEKLGTTRTTRTGDHATVEDVEDSGGRVYFKIPTAQQLAVGRHRVRLVVAGDQTSTDLWIDVVPKGSPIVVSDVDGTLTESETAELPALGQGVLPGAQPGAAELLSAFAARGYHVVYVTARPEWLVARTRQFLAASHFPRGVVHTTTGLTGALGDAAVAYKSAVLAKLAAHGLAIEWAFGNQPSDADAYESAKIKVDHRVFLRVTDPHGGRRIESYGELLPLITGLPATCN